ncbi:hypothetical protein DSM112329_01972 [Paraconexibacter sp. AEG42_29]|uniref:PucR C-terminal helix-turn-helix domain-containing protein n=1 Tax=Paraconexibacter sp. AEG42_29 TaxID=2997339 RepID=A0AAU7ATX1_9ACTN
MAGLQSLQPPPLGSRDRERLRTAIDAASPRLVELSDAITRRVLSVHPAFQAAVGDARVLAHQATIANVGTIVSTLALGIAPAQLDVPDGVRGLLDHVAIDEAGLPTFLRAYRLAEADLNRWWIAELTEHADDAAQLARLIAHSMSHIAGYVDHGCEVIAERWSAMVETSQRTGRQRDAALRALLRGEQVDPGLLGHPLDVPQLVLACHAVPPVGAAAAVTGAAQHLPRMALELADGTLLVWVAAADAAARLPAVLAGAPAGAWLVAAVAPPGPDALGPAATQVRDGLLAARRMHPGGAAVPLAEVALIATLLADEARARQMVQAVLGPLAAPTSRNADLRATVRAYFEAGERKTGAGAMLGIHAKTVAHRLARVEELLGSRIADRRVVLETALLLQQALEPA